MTTKKPMVLCILDGWGYNKEKTGNTIELANTPNWHRMLNTYPNTLLNASGEEVGLPIGQMGNSEVGHTNIGAGRIVMQLLGKIEKSIRTNTLGNTPALKDFITTVKQSTGICHIMGLLSDGGVHAHIDHIIALCIETAHAGLTTYLHLITDGRDTAPSSAIKYIKDLIEKTKNYPNIKIATICGRYYAMDRNNTWERTKLAYDAIIDGIGGKFTNPIDAVNDSYKNETTDEFIKPLVNVDYKGATDGDGFLIANFRADRVRQIAESIANPDFVKFHRPRFVKFSTLLGMAEYSVELNKFYKTLFPATPLKNILGEVVANHGLCQLRIAETEKYAHVTFFFNGGEEKIFHCEDRILIPSPNVATYNLKPEMSAYEITETLEKVIAENKYDVIIVNYANCDMVGHSGLIPATIKAVETIDICIGRLEKAVLEKHGTLLITADHGNCEKMLDNDNKPFTAHTSNPVPLVLIGSNNVNNLKSNGKLADIAPTILKLLNIAIPNEMDGIPLV